MVFIRAPSTPMQYDLAFVLPLRLLLVVCCLLTSIVLVSFDFVNQVYLLPAPSALAGVRSDLLRRFIVAQRDVAVPASMKLGSSLSFDAVTGLSGAPADVTISSLGQCTTVKLTVTSCWCMLNATHVTRLDPTSGVASWIQPKHLDNFIFSLLSAVSINTTTDALCGQHFDGSIALWSCDASSCSLLQSWTSSQRVVSCLVAGDTLHQMAAVALSTGSTSTLTPSSTTAVFLPTAATSQQSSWSNGTCIWTATHSLDAYCTVSQQCASSAAKLTWGTARLVGGLSSTVMAATASWVLLSSDGSIAWCTAIDGCGDWVATGAVQLLRCVPRDQQQPLVVLCVAVMHDGSTRVLAVGPTIGSLPLTTPALPLLPTLASDTVELLITSAGLSFVVGTTLYATSSLGHWREAGTLTPGGMTTMTMWPTAEP